MSRLLRCLLTIGIACVVLASALHVSTADGADAPKSAAKAKKKKKPAAKLPPTFPSGNIRPFGAETQVLGGTQKKITRDAAPEGGVLVGLEIGLGKLGSSDVIGAVRGIYLVGDQESFGRQFGSDLSRVVTVKAKPGYAVGAAALKAGLLVDGMALYFMKIDDDRLDVDDVYASQWVGGTGGESPKIIGGDGRPATGVLAKTDDKSCTGVGLRFAPGGDTPADAAAPAEDAPTLHRLLQSDSLPDGYRVTQNSDSTINGQQTTTIVIMSKANLARAVVTIDYRDLHKADMRRTTAKGYINGSGKTLAAAGMKIVDQKIPDLESATFETPLSVDLTGEKDDGSKLFLHGEIFFTDKGFNVMVASQDADAMAVLSKWAKTIKPAPDTAETPQTKPEPKKKKKG